MLSPPRSPAASGTSGRVMDRGRATLILASVTRSNRSGILFRRMHISLWILAFFLLPSVSLAQELVSFPTEDGGTIHADVYGEGERGVVLAHGGRFNKESWAPQARELERAGYRVLAIDFRGYGESRGPGQEDIYSAPLQLDVLAGVRYLHRTGAKTVAVIGSSLGGGAAASAAMAEPGLIDRLVVLGATPDGPRERLTVRKLYVMARDDTSGAGPRLPALRAHFKRAPEPKELLVLEGSAHAQLIFDTEQGERLMREILRFLSAP